MPNEYIYSDKWRNCEGRRGVNQGGWCHFESANTAEGEVNCIYCLVLIPYDWL